MSERINGIWDYIIKHYEVGEEVSAHEIASDLGIDHVTVLAALKMLEAEGVLKPNTQLIINTSVIEDLAKEIHEVYLQTAKKMNHGNPLSRVSWDKLDEKTKEFDRALDRWVILSFKRRNNVSIVQVDLKECHPGHVKEISPGVYECEICGEVYLDVLA